MAWTLDKVKAERQRAEKIQPRTSVSQAQVDAAAQATMTQNQIAPTGGSLVEKATAPRYSEVELPGVRDNAGRMADRRNNRIRNSIDTKAFDDRLAELNAKLESTPVTYDLNDNTRYRLKQDIVQLEQQKEQLVKGELERLKAEDWEKRQSAAIKQTGDETLPADLQKLHDLKAELDAAAAGSGNSPKVSIRANEAQKEYNALLKELQSKYGENLDGWQSYVSRMSNKEEAENMQEALAAKAKENPFLMGLAARPINMGSGLGFVDVLGQKAQRTLTGSDVPIDYNTLAMRPAQATKAIDKTVSEEIEEGTEGWIGSDTPFGNIYSGMYGLGTSVVDSYIGAKTGTSLFMAGSAATNTMLDAKERGATDDQAIMLGLSAGAMEAVMEKMSIDKLVKQDDPKTAWQFVKNAAKQGLVEVPEELGTNVANTVADAIIMGDKSQLNMTRAYYIEQGYTPEEAEKMALKDWGKSLVVDAVGAMISAGALSAANGLPGYINNKIQNQKQRNKPIDNTWTPEQKANLDKWLDDWMQEGREPAAAPNEDMVSKMAQDIQKEASIEPAAHRQTAAQILNDGIFESPVYGEALQGTGLKRSDVRQALRDISRGVITAQADTNVQTVLHAIQNVDAQPAQAQTPVQVEPLAAKVEDIMPKAAPTVDVDAAVNNVRAEGTGTVGDMGAKTSDFPHEVKESQSKTTPYYYEKNNIPEEGRADNHYTVVHRDESLHNARSRLEQDYDGEVADLRSKTTWSDEEMLEGDLILRNLRDEAEQTGDWSKHREWAKVFKEHKTEAGRSLSVLAMLSNESGDAILSHAAETLEHATKGTDANAVMQTVSEYATRYDEAVAAKNVDDLISIIKETARTRKTGFYSGKLGQISSAPLDWALKRIANYAKSDAAAGTVATATPKAFQVGDVVSPSDRGNFGKVVNVNEDGTYDVHFVSKSGHEATKTFAAEELKSPHTGGVTAADISTDPNSAFAFLKSFAAAGIENIASDTNRASVVDMAKTIRRSAMLSKFSTIMRNFVGNGLFDIADSVARDVSVPLDMLLSKVTGTRSVAADYSYLSEAKRKGVVDGLAMAMLETSLDVNARNQQSKYENGSNRTFKMSGGVVSKTLSTWEGLMGYGLYVTDEMSKGGTSAEIQRGINRLYEQGKIKDDSLRDGGNQEALYRTFQDDTKLSRGTAKIKEGLNEFYGAGDIMMPFAQVPANLADRAIDYSPAGLAESAYRLGDVLVKAKKGTLTAAEQAKAVQNIGRNLTGTGMIALAMNLAARGLIHVVNPGGEDENKNKAASEKAQGLSGTQWNVSAMLRDIKGESTEWQDGDTLMSIAFLEPFNAHLTIGALLAEDLEAEGTLTAKTILDDSFGGSLMAICDLPMFAAFGEAYDAYQYSDKKRGYQKLGDAAVTMGANALGGFMPNAWKGLAQGLDPYQRDLYAKEGVFGQTADQFRSVFGRDGLPVKQDVYGNDVKNPNQPLNFLNANILPGAITTYTETDLQGALNDLSKQTGSNSMYLGKDAPKSITLDGIGKVELTEEQQKQFMSDRGDAYSTASAALEASAVYQGMPDDLKLKAYEYAENFATQAANVGVSSDYKPTDWFAELEGATPEEIGETMIRKAVESMADGNQYQNKYDGLSQMLESGSIDEDMVVKLLPDDQEAGYINFIQNSRIPMDDYLDVIEYWSGKDIKQEDVKAYIEKGFASDRDRCRVWQCFYSKNTIPDEWQ